MNKNSQPLDTIRTRIAGTMSGDEAETRQLSCEKIRALMDAGQRVYIDLVPEPTNAYDADAIQAFVNLPDLGRVQLGFLPNGKTVCDFCGQEHARAPKASASGPARCARCGHHDQLRRDGTATLLSQELRRDPSAAYYGEVLAITGGTEGKTSFGCNLILRRSVRKPE